MISRERDLSWGQQRASGYRGRGHPACGALGRLAQGVELLLGQVDLYLLHVRHCNTINDLRQSRCGGRLPRRPPAAKRVKPRPQEKPRPLAASGRRRGRVASLLPADGFALGFEGGTGDRLGVRLRVDSQQLPLPPIHPKRSYSLLCRWS